MSYTPSLVGLPRIKRGAAALQCKVMNSYPSSEAKGFTLIEVVVGIAIVSIITILTVTAFPFIRERQQVSLATQEFESALRRAQQLALFETRHPQCLQNVGSEAEKQRRCSDVGIVVDESELITYADTVSDDRYTPDEDFVLSRIPVPANVVVSAKAFLFEASPPTITMFVDGEVRAAHQTETITITSGSVTANLVVSAYGFVNQ